ncbi:MAG: ABC transporter substrate-binding protein [Bacillota bacterium]
MKKIILVLLIAFSLNLLVSSGCTKQGTNLEELVVGIGKDTVDPNGGMWESRGLVFETLVTLNDKGEPQPLLARRWEIAPDGKSYTFFLQENVKFHDGTPFNALTLKENVTKLHTIWGRYPLDKIEIVNDYTVRFCLREPYPLFIRHIAQIANGMVVSPRVLEEVSGEANKGMGQMPPAMSGGQGESKQAMGQMPPKEGMSQMPPGMGKPATPVKEVRISAPVGTGPYKLIEHVPGQYWVMEAIDDYWQGPVGIKRIKYLVIPDAHSRIMALESGQIHLTGISPLSRIAAGDMALIEKNKELVLKHEPSFIVTPIAFNTVKGVFTDARVREAFVKAINLEDINKVLTPVGTTLDTPVAPASPFYLPELAGTRKYDPAMAQELLKQAGWVKGTDGMLQKDGQPLQVNLVYTQTHPEMIQIASILQQQLRAIGITLKLSQVESGALFASLARKDYDLIASPGIGSASLDFATDYHSKGRYSVGVDQELDSLIEAYNTAPSFNEQKLIAKKVQEKILANDLVLLYFSKNKSFAHVARLQNFKPALEEEVNFMRHIWQAIFK